MGFSAGSVGKESACDEGDTGNKSSIPELGSFSLEEKMAPHSSIVAWKIPWMEETGGLQSMGLQRVRHDWAHAHTHTHTHTHTQLIYNIVLVSGPQHNDSIIQLPYFKNTSVPTWPEMFRKELEFWYLQRLQISTLHLPESRVTAGKGSFCLCC